MGEIVYRNGEVVYHSGEKFSVGGKLRIIPNHACTVVNLHDQAWLVDGDKVIEKINIEARGKLT